MRITPPGRAVVLAAACCLVLTSCDDGDTEAAGEESLVPVAASTPATASEPATVEPAPAEPASTEPSATSEPSVASETPVQVAGAACLTGTWKLRNETFEDALRTMLEESPEIPADMREGMVITLTGDSHMRFDGIDLFTTWQDDFTMTMTARGQTIAHVIDSGDAGNYGASAEHIWVHDMQQLYMTAEMRIDGIGTVALDSASPGMASVDVFGFQTVVPGVDRELVDGAATYTCGTTDLVLHGDLEMSASFARVSHD